MMSYCHTWQYYRIGAYPHIVAYDDRLRTDSLLVNSLGGILKVVIESRHRDALCQVHMIANAHGPYHRTMDADAGVVAYHHIAHSIVDAAI